MARANYMARVYADLIKKGTVNEKTGEPYCIDDVPANLREEVEAILAEDTNKTENDVESVKIGTSTEEIVEE